METPKSRRTGNANEWHRAHNVEVSDHGIPLRSVHGSAQADLIRALILLLFHHLITIIDITIFNSLITIK